MTLIVRKASSIDAIVATVGEASSVLFRYDFEEGAAISYLFDGDEDRRFTCQWRIIAGSDDRLRELVDQLLESLRRHGVSTNAPRYSDLTCRIVDCGPWDPSRPGMGIVDANN